MTVELVALLQRQAVDGDVDARLVLADHHEEIGEESTATRLRDPHVGAHYAAALDRPDVMRLWRDEVPDREHRTRKRVDAMTDAESAQMAPWAKKWIEIGLCTKPADRVMFEAACRACYRLSGLPEPVSIVWADSPLVVAYAGPIAAWWIDTLTRRLDASVDTSVRASVRDKSRSKIATEIKKHFGNQWHNWFGGQLWVGGWYWYGDPSVTTFVLDVLRLQLDRQQELRARAYAATAMSACYWWPGRTHVIVSERPHTIEKRGDGRLKRIAWKGWEVAP